MADEGVRGSGLREALQTVGLVAPPVALLTGLLFYFGWVRTRQYWQVFGVEHSLLDLSVQDYLLRGIDAVHLPLAAVAMTVVAAVWGWSAWTSWEGRAAHATTVAWARWALLAAGLVALATGLALAARDGTVWGRAACWTLAAGIVAVALAELARMDLARAREGERGDPARGGSPAVVLAASATLLMLALFWVFADHAGVAGRLQAERRAASLTGRAGIVLYSPDELFIEGPGVQVRRLAGDGAYRYRYTGLTLILHTNDRYVLLPSGWEEGAASIVVPVADAPRVDFTSDAG